MDTTVTISDITAKKLNKICKAHEISKRKFLDAMLDYFLKYGINPLENESPAKEMEKVVKRLSAIVGFLKTQEETIIKPACEMIKTNETYIKLYLEKLSTKQDLSLGIKQLNDNIRLGIENNKQMHTLLSQTRSNQQESFIVLSKLIDEKNQSGLSDKIKNIFSR